MSRVGLLSFFGVLLSAVAALLLAAVVTAAQVPDPKLPIFGLAVPARLMPWLIVAATAGAAACITAALARLASRYMRNPDSKGAEASADRPGRGAVIAVSLAPIAAVALVFLAASLQEAGVPEGGDARSTPVVLGLAAAAFMALITLVAASEKGRKVGVESHWGGLGGLVGGWSLTTPAVALLVFLSCVGGLIGLVAGPDKAVPENETMHPTNEVGNEVGTDIKKDEDALKPKVVDANTSVTVVSDPNKGRTLSPSKVNE